MNAHGPIEGGHISTRSLSYPGVVYCILGGLRARRETRDSDSPRMARKKMDWDVESFSNSHYITGVVCSPGARPQQGCASLGLLLWKNVFEFVGIYGFLCTCFLKTL